MYFQIIGSKEKYDMENFLELAKARYSCRKFVPKMIEDEVLNKILEAGRVSPTAVDFQPQRVLVIRDEESIQKLKQSTKYTFNAPVILMICYDMSEAWKDPFECIDIGTVDATIVATQMMLEAADLGVGSTFVGHFNTKKMTEDFNIPEYLKPVCLLPMGYPCKEHPAGRPCPQHKKRKTLEETVFFDTFANIKEGPFHARGEEH